MEAVLWKICVATRSGSRDVRGGMYTSVLCAAPEVRDA